MSVKGNFNSLAQFSEQLKRLPTVVAQKIASAAAAPLTAVANQTFNASEDAYGNAWKSGKDGQTVTLKKSGTLVKFLQYVAIGTKLRVALGVPYAKYQIGKRPVFPRQGGDLPESYVRVLQRVAVDTIRAEMGR